MKKLTLNSNTMSINLIGLSVLLDISLLSTAAFGATFAPINFDVIVRNETVGKIEINVKEGLLRNQGLEGAFEITKKNESSSSTMTIPELAKFLKVDHFNWFQIVTAEYPLTSPENPGTFIDPPSGGFDVQWADDRPWYLDEYLAPNPLPPGKTKSGLLLSDYIKPSKLEYEDFPQGHPVGAKLNFDTFLIGDFGNKTYDVLGGGFSWQVEFKPGEPFIDLNRNGKWDFGEPFTDLNNDRIWNRPNPAVTSLKPGTTFTFDYAQRIQNEFGYTKVLKLPTYEFDGNLTPGQVNSFTKSELPANVPFLTWTDNLPGINPPNKPDTVLRALDGTGEIQRNYNNNGGPLGQNKASGLVSSVNLDPSKAGGIYLPTVGGTITENKGGIINLEVTGATDLNFNGLKDGTCDPHPEQGNYKLLVKLYENSFYPGGGVFSVPNVYPASTDCVKTEIPNFPPCIGGSGGGGCFTITSLAANRYTRPSSVPEPTTVLGLLALSTWGAVQGLKIRKSKP